MTPRYTFSLLLSFLLMGQFAFAGITGKLSGIITSKDTGEPLIGANVIIEETTLGAATDENGNYFILQIPPGTYTVRVTMIGYQTLILNDVRIKVDLTTALDGALPESAVSMDEVVVQAERPMIQTDVTYSQANISSEEVEMLPVEEFEDVLALQAGVVMTGGEIHVRGGRGGEISYMIDGITVTDPYNSGMAVEIENNAIQELQFISGTFNAEYGQAMSGIVNIITKDGDYSKFSGSMSASTGDYHSADNTLFPQLDIKHSAISDKKGNLEGPIVPGKVSFFVSGREKINNGYLYGQRIFHPNSFIWSESENIFKIDSTVGLGNNGFVPDDGDDLKLVIDSLRAEDAFDWVPMNWYEQTTYQAKVSFRLTSGIKMSYNRMYSDTRSQDYSHAYRWNPDGRGHSFNTRTGDLFRMDVSLSQSTFANVMYSRAVNHYRSHLSDEEDFYEVLEDADYIHITPADSFLMGDSAYFVFGPDTSDWFEALDTLLYNTDPEIFNYAAGFNFGVGGQSMDIYNRKSIVETMKAELTSQVNALHQVKAGVEYRSTNITMNDLSVLLTGYTGYQPRFLEPDHNTIHDSFQSISEDGINNLDGRNPLEFSAYLQDKIESDDMVVNMGLRYDYFDSQWKVLNDFEDPNYLSPVKPINIYYDLDSSGTISEEEMYGQNRKTDSTRLESNANGVPWFSKSKPKTQISPRFALAFPITDKGHLHFSYGHFFQNPSFSYIYDNPEFEVPAASGISSTMGNANMEPQRTTQYEVGFSQQIGRDIGVEITGYFKDIRNLNSTEIKKSFIAGDRYGMYVNKDHANSRGITVAISKRSRQKFSGNLDYTYSISEGNASDPTAAFFDEQSNIEPEKMLVPLDWDQRHTLNGTMTYRPIKASGVSVVFNYGSGFPYTTEGLDGQRTSFENNGRKPPTYNVDLKSFLNFPLTKAIQISAHINVYNLFDIRNELTVYSNTGRSTYSLAPTYTPQYSGPMLNSLDEYLVVPSYYSAPKQIKVGISLSFK